MAYFPYLPPPPTHTALSAEEFRNQQQYEKCVLRLRFIKRLYSLPLPHHLTWRKNYYLVVPITQGEKGKEEEVLPVLAGRGGGEESHFQQRDYNICLWFCQLDVGMQLGCMGAILMRLYQGLSQ